MTIAQARHIANAEQPSQFSAHVLAHLRGDTMTDAYEQGMEVRRAVLGDEHVDRAIARTNDLTADFQELITRYAWGGIWTRPDSTAEPGAASR